MDILSHEMVQALGVIVGLVVVAILVIRASSSQSKYATKSMEHVVSVMAGGLRDDMRASQGQIHDDLRAYQGQVHDEQHATRKRVESMADRVNVLASAVTQVRDEHGERLIVIERTLGGITTRDLDS